jgi:23S rRNA (cytidine1920-2'-O)/16S rRNA (cytidine1409-2'-O)-methyltransferase
VTRVRLDQLLVARGLAASRERARTLILAGEVRVAGRPAAKAGDLVPDDTELTVSTPDHPYVSRGGVKLAHALEAFGIDVTGRLALDVGASTGGFTDVLLRRGARRVVALDVGHGQLAWSLRTDPRVVVVERTNARSLTAADLPADTRLFDFICVDVSFISLRLILPALLPLTHAGTDLVVLVKPQFEAGRGEVGKGGIVRDPQVHERVLRDVQDAAAALGFAAGGIVASPIEGADGNREFLLCLRPGTHS